MGRSNAVLTEEIIEAAALKCVEEFGLPDDGYVYDPIYGRININKALRDRRIAEEQELEDYEAFDLMHKYDGTFTKSESGLSRL